MRSSVALEKTARTFPIVENIETLTKRAVLIETQATDANLAKCHPQTQSELFQIPSELRNTIFEYACAPYNDPRVKYDVPELCYIPDHHRKRIVSWSILLICRRVWLEANHLPMQIADHTFRLQNVPTGPKYFDKLCFIEERRLDRE